RRPEIPHSRNSITTNPNISVFRFGTVAIENRAASENNVEIYGTWRWRWRWRWILREHCKHQCRENSEAKEIPLHHADSRRVERRCRFENVCWRPKPYSTLPPPACSTNLLSAKPRGGDRAPC